MQTMQTRDGPISLLFSPPTSDPLTEKQSSPLARSATKVGRDEGTAAFHSFRDYTPVHRRRNTPSNSNRQASPLLSGGGPSTSPSPPPPPTMSLFDTAGGEASASPMNVSGGKDQYTSDRRQTLGRPTAQHMPLLQHGMRVEDYEDCWVTVYGFHQTDVPLVLKEFSKCGEIVDFGHFTDGPYVNWIHVCFDTKYAAQRALLRSGHQLSPTCMVGVKEMDAGKKERILQSTTTTGGHGVDADDDDTTTTARASSYRPASFLEAQKKAERKVVAAEQPVVPLEATSMWEKVCEFVLGI
jgi:hypothetical protein